MGGILHTCIAVVVLLFAFVLGIAYIFEQKIQDLQNELASLKRKRSETKVELLDNTGYTGGSLYTHKGAASNYLCLPENPQWGTRSLKNFQAFVYGAEYENNFFGENALQQDVPCSVCKTKTGTNSVMIPARTSCYDGWTIQYKGYLGAGYHDHSASTEYICVDENVQFVPGGYENKNGVLIYPVVAKCGSLRCHPYIENKPIACVVCSN